MTDVERLEAAKKILDRSFKKIKKDSSSYAIIFTDKNGKQLSPDTKLWELADDLEEGQRVIEIRLVLLKAMNK